MKKVYLKQILHKHGVSLLKRAKINTRKEKELKIYFKIQVIKENCMNLIHYLMMNL